MLAARVRYVFTAPATIPTLTSTATKQSSRMAVLSLCKSLLLLRDRLRLRPILTKFGFCMKGLLYKTTVLLPEGGALSQPPAYSATCSPRSPPTTLPT